MLKKILILMLVVGVFACQQQDQQLTAVNASEISARDGRLVFATEEIYADKVAELEGMKPDEQKRWMKQFKYSPLMNVIDKVKEKDLFIEQNLPNLTTGHFFVLNEDRLIQFGDDIVLFDGHTKYYMNVNEFEKLTNKKDIMNSPRRNEFRGEVIGVARELVENDNGRVESTYFDAWNKGDIGVGGHQSTFWWSSVQKKFTDEYYVFTESFGTDPNGCGGDHLLRSRLYMRMKLQTKSGSSWVATSELRNYYWNFSWSSVTFYYGAHLCSYNDLTMTGMSGSDNNSALNQSTNYLLLMEDTGTFTGEYHATFDLKKWEGIATGRIQNRYNPAPLTDTWDF